MGGGYGSEPRAELAGEQVGGQVERPSAVGRARDRGLRRPGPCEQARGDQPHERREGQREKDLDEGEAHGLRSQRRRLEPGAARSGALDGNACAPGAPRSAEPCLAHALAPRRPLTAAAAHGRRAAGATTRRVRHVRAGPSGRRDRDADALRLARALGPSRQVRRRCMSTRRRVGRERQSNARTLRWMRSSSRIQAATSRRIRLPRSACAALPCRTVQPSSASATIASARTHFEQREAAAPLATCRRLTAPPPRVRAPGSTRRRWPAAARRPGACVR